LWGEGKAKHGNKTTFSFSLSSFYNYLFFLASGFSYFPLTFFPPHLITFILYLTTFFIRFLRFLSLPVLSSVAKPYQDTSQLSDRMALRLLFVLEKQNLMLQNHTPARM
jgi:hypothetical protein